MLPLLIAGGAVVAAALLSGCDNSPPTPSEPVTVPPPPEPSAPIEEPAPTTAPSVSPMSFFDSLPPSDAPSLVPSNPCGVKLGSKGMSRFLTSNWSESGLKREQIEKVADLTPLGQDRFLVQRGNCAALPTRQFLRVTQEEFKGLAPNDGMRLATVSLLACFQNKKCTNDEYQRLQFALPSTESLLEVYLIDEDNDGIEDFLFTSDGKYSYVLYGERLKP